jgi:hypothetical protein
METIIIVLLIIYAGIKDYLSYKEREKLELKLMSKSVSEYKETAYKEKEPENTKEPDNPFISIEDASYEQILKAKDVL